MLTAVVSAPRRLLLTAAVVCGGLGLMIVAPSASAQVIYFNDFETNTDGFSSTTVLPTTGSGFGSSPTSTYLGRFDNGVVGLALDNLTPGETYTIGFDLFIGGSWDGNDPVKGAATWGLTQDAVTQIVNTSFNNVGGTQDYSDINPNGVGNYASFTGADAFFVGVNSTDRYAIYRFGGSGNPTLGFIAPGATTRLGFYGRNPRRDADEFWAIDNVIVTRVTNNVAAPEPGSIGLLLGGIVPLAACLRRRRAAL